MLGFPAFDAEGDVQSMPMSNRYNGPVNLAIAVETALQTLNEQLAITALETATHTVLCQLAPQTVPLIGA